VAGGGKGGKGPISREEGTGPLFLKEGEGKKVNIRELEGKPRILHRM